MAREGASRDLNREAARLHRQLEAVPAPAVSKLSANVDADLYERLRELAHIHRVSESSIVDVALRRFFALGDDVALGPILHASGATLRRKQSARRRS
jgi:hypothetical protein